VPDAFEKFSKVTTPAADVSAADIAKNRDKWIQDWTQAVLR
jgi:ABC-type thiamine transport system substrate-binding protein